MPYYLICIDNRRFYKEEESSIDPDPLIRWPWLDPFWGVVEQTVEGVQVRDWSAKTAEMIVEANEDFLATWPLGGSILTGVAADGQMVVAREGTLFHVTTHKLTELEGIFAHNLFAQPVPTRVEDLDTELLSRGEEYVIQRIQEELGPHGKWVDSCDIAEVAFRCLIEVDLLTADYRDIDECIDKALKLLADRPLKGEDRS